MVPVRTFVIVQTSVNKTSKETKNIKKKEQEIFVKHYAPFLSQMFCTTGFVSSKYVAQMYEDEIHLGKVLLKQTETALARLTPVTF